MEIKRFLRVATILAVLIVMSLSLSACFKSASQGPTGTGGSQMPIPGETKQSGVEVATTATKAAEQGGTNKPSATAVAVTETPQQQPQATEVPHATATPLTYVQATPGIPKEYVLQYGEFPFCIARRFDVNQYELLNINGLGLNSPVYVGMTLTIPQTGNHFDGPVALKTHPDTYKVKSGDTLNIIACKYGNTSPELIALQNGLSVDATLTVGQVLVIP